MEIKTKEEYIKRFGKVKDPFWHYSKGVEYAEQQCDVVYELFSKPAEVLKPLEDLWRKENPREKFTTPDRTEFYKWIVDKIKQAEQFKPKQIDWDNTARKFFKELKTDDRNRINEPPYVVFNWLRKEIENELE